MRRPARPTLATGAAIAASVIALVSAAVAWLRLQDPANANDVLPSPGGQEVLGFAVPLIAVATAVGLSWLARRLGKAQRQLHGTSDPPDDLDHAALNASPGRSKSEGSTWRRDADRKHHSVFTTDRPGLTSPSSRLMPQRRSGDRRN